MENINSDELKNLLSIIQIAPMQRIGHFSSSDSKLSALLSELCQTNEYEYLLNSTDVNIIDSLQATYKDYDFTKIKFFDLARKSYLQSGLFYEYLFVSVDIPDNQKDIFLKKSHKCIKNAGLIIIFCSDNETEHITWQQLLEDNYFVATNKIELNDNHCVIVSKKMHGWGK